MTTNNTRDCIETKKSDDEKEINCKRRIRGFLRFMGYQCSTDPATLREEAVRKLKEIEKRKRKHENSLDTNIFQTNDDGDMMTSMINHNIGDDEGIVISGMINTELTITYKYRKLIKFIK